MDVIFWQLMIQNYYVPACASTYPKEEMKMGTHIHHFLSSLYYQDYFVIYVG